MCSKCQAKLHIKEVYCNTCTRQISALKILLLSIKRRDLKAETAVLTVHSHDGAVVNVHNETSGYVSARLAHEVSSLGEEVLPVPAGRHQARFTAG